MREKKGRIYVKRMKAAPLKLTYAALCLALCIILPFFTGQIPAIGAMLSPMHIPVLLCGFLCGAPYGLIVGFVAPLLRGSIFGMPALMPTGISMAFELATYGALTGILYRVFPKKPLYVYVSLILAMIGGRITFGIFRFILMGINGTEFSLALWISGTVTGSIPGIIIQILLIPPIVLALGKAGLIPEEKKKSAKLK